VVFIAFFFSEMGELEIHQKIESQEIGHNISPIIVSEEECKKLLVYVRGSDSHRKRGFTYFEGDAAIMEKYVFPIDIFKNKVLRTFFIQQSKLLLFKDDNIAAHCLSYHEKDFKNGNRSIYYYNCAREHIRMEELLDSKKLAGCSVPLTALEPEVFSSFHKLLENPDSITSEEVFGYGILGYTAASFEISPSGRKIGQHVEPFFFESVNINRSGNLYNPNFSH
jgi:hypothetical protein